MKMSKSVSRRDFIARSAAGAAAVAIPWQLFCSGGEKVMTSLYFSEDDLPRIRKNIKLPYLQKYWESLYHSNIKDSEHFLTHELNTRNHIRHLGRAGKILRESSFVSRIGESRKHADLAKLAMEKILSFAEWDFFLEGGKDVIGIQRASKTTIAMALAYDWLDPWLSSREKKDIVTAVAQKGVPPCYLTLYGMENPDKVKGWTFNPTSELDLEVDLSRWPYFLNDTNLKMIPISGLAVGAVFLYEKDPHAAKWLDMAELSLKKFTKLYAKDGSYPEGVGYWGYASQHLVLTLDLLKRKFNKDYSDLINFTGTINFGLQMQMPSLNKPDDTVNFGDAGNKIDFSLGFWIARKFENGIAQFTAQKFNDRQNIFAFVWCDDSEKPNYPGKELYDVRFDDDRIVLRTGWNVDDTVLAFRSGGPANHEHADRNSIILKAYGERLLNDPFHASYEPKDKHWLLRQTEAHNAILIDGKGHQYHDGSEGTNSSKAEAEIIRYSDNDNFIVLTSDATQAYNLVNNDVKKVRRTVIFIKPEIIVLFDEFEKEHSASRFQARFFPYDHDTKAALTCINRNNMFVLSRPNASLFCRVLADCSIQLRKNKLDLPEDIGHYPFVEISTARKRKCRLVTACAVKNKKYINNPQISMDKITEGFKVTYKSEKNSGRITIIPKSGFPSIERS